MNRAEATFKFFKSLKNLVDQGLIKSIDQAKAFAKQEFGEVSDLMTLQINKIFKNKNQPVVGKKDPVFDNTVETIPFDDTGAPFNPRDPQKVYGKPKANPNRAMTADELEDFEMEISPDNLEAYDFDGTVEDGARILREEKKYTDDMFLEYKKGKLDPVAGDKSPARKRFLEKKLEEMEMSGDTRLMSQDEIEELATFDLGTDMDKKSEYQKTIEAIDAFDNDINIRLIQKELKKEFPGITDEMIENILTDKNPQRIAEVKQTMREALEMQDKGMEMDEIINIFKKTPRTKQAKGGRIKMAKGGLPNILGF